MFLAIRMLVYIAAVPVAAWLGGTYDPALQTITINADTGTTDGSTDLDWLRKRGKR